MKNKILTALLGVFVVIFLITFSIGLPIYFRPFYYMQIEPLEIERRTGFTREEIIEGYDEVLDYLTVPGGEFGIGKFAYSEEGKSHFEDCKLLFDLNASLLALSLGGIVAVMILLRKGVFKLARPLGCHYLLTCGAATLSVFAALGLIVSIDFNSAFEIFHKIFFPGKDNWIFNSFTDEIIRALPQEFFMNCAILIASSIILVSVGFIAFGIIEKRNKNTAETA